MHDCHGSCLRVLVAYYSCTGNTRTVAQMLRERTCGVLFGVETRTPCDTVTVDAAARHERERAPLPALKYPVPPMRHYDVILVGGPVWHHTLPAPLRAFLQQADFNGRRVAPFCTYELGTGSFFSDFAAQARNADLMQGFTVNIARHNRTGEAGAVIDSYLHRLNQLVRCGMNGSQLLPPGGACADFARAQRNSTKNT